MGVKSTHSDYDRFAKQWKRCRDVVAGEDAIRAGGKAYLRKFEGEEDEEYNRRLADVGFLNATWRTISGFVGLAFSEDPVRALPGAIEGFSGDITMAGVSLDALAEMIVEEVMEVGRCGILVDHPPMPENVTGITVAAQEALGLRPSIAFYPAESIRNWKFAKRANKWTLVQVVLGESEVVAKDEFESKNEDRYRVLDFDEAGNYRQRLFKVVDDKDVLIGDPIYPTVNGRNLSYIPFAMIGRSGKGDQIDEPPLIDLVDRNIKHYKIEAGLDNSLYFACSPTMVIAGYHDDSKPFYIGSSKAIVLPDPNARVEYAEIKGDSIPAVERRLAELKIEMAALGAQMLTENVKRDRTATEAAIDASGENSILGGIVGATSKAIEWALGVMAEWVGASGEIKYQINRNFLPTGMAPDELRELVSAMQVGAISQQELFLRLQRGRVIEPAKTFEEHQAEVESAPMPRPVAANMNGGIAA